MLLTLIGSSAVSYVSVTPAETPAAAAGPEITVALEVLQRLTQRRSTCEELAKYAIFLRGVLDFAERLAPAQAAALLRVLCEVAGGASDELFILVRKYLGMSDGAHRRMGVLGCVALLAHRSTDEEVGVGRGRESRAPRVSSASASALLATTRRRVSSSTSSWQTRCWRSLFRLLC